MRQQLSHQDIELEALKGRAARVDSLEKEVRELRGMIETTSGKK